MTCLLLTEVPPFLFQWNGIHDDVDYFVKHNGRLQKKVNEDANRSFSQLVVRKSTKGRASAKRERVVRREPINDPEYLAWADENKAFHRKLKRIRLWFLLSGLLMIISSILFFEQGVKRVFNSLDDAQAGLHVGCSDYFVRLISLYRSYTNIDWFLH